MNHPLHMEWTWTWPPALFAAALALLAVFTVWIYRHTLPPAPARVRILLILLRFTALLLISLALFGAVAGVVRREEKPATVALLIDRSMSMQIRDGVVRRQDTADSLLGTASMADLARSADLKTVLFSATVDTVFQGLPDSVDYSGQATGLSDVLEALPAAVRPLPSSVLILSDGRKNTGGNPSRAASALGVPVHTITVGRDVQQRDLILSRTMTNDIVYAGDEIPVDAAVRGPGFGGSRVTVDLRDGPRVLDQKRIVLPGEGNEAEVTLKYRPEEPGYRLLKVAVAGMEGELSLENNSREFMVRILESKIGVLFICGAPSPDLRFITRLMESDRNITVTRRTEKKGGGFYEGAFPPAGALSDMDVWILLDFPGPDTPAPLWQAISKIILERKPPLLILGNRSDPSRLEEIKPLLPYLSARRANERIVPAVMPEGELHPAVRMENTEESVRLWGELPPVFGSVRDLRLKPESRVLLSGIPETARAGRDAGNPLLIARHFEEEKCLFLPASGIYRWDFVMWGLGRDNRLIGHFLSQAVRWLSTREADSRVRLEMDRTLFRPGEQIHIDVQVYDETLRPVSKAEVSANIQTPSGSLPVVLEETAMGRYRKVLRLFERGEYRIRVEASLDGREVGVDKGVFHLSGWNLEYMDTRADPEGMSLMAAVTGGRSGPPDSLDGILRSIRPEPRSVQVKSETVFRRRTEVLLLVSLLLSLEWFIRKRRGML